MSTAASVATQVTLYFKCKNLKDTDTFSKSDPYIVLFRNDRERLIEIGRTEVVMDCLNPVFQKSLNVDYYFEVKQQFVAKLYDYDGHSEDEKNDALGVVQFSLANIMCAAKHIKSFDIPAPFQGTLTVTAVEHSTTGDDTIALEFYGRNMKQMDFIGGSDPYFILHRTLPDGQRQKLYQSEVIDSNLNPDWKPLPTIKVSALMGRDSSEKTLDFDCFDKDVFGKKDMGHVLLSVDDLLQASLDQRESKLILRKDHKPENLYGYIYVRKCAIRRCVTFQDLLSAGWQINAAVSVDFTASNGDPRDSRSLHHYNAATPNQYVRAITSVCEVLMDYDSDGMIAAFGFGALMPDGKTSHHFHLNLLPDPYVAGIAGLLAAYHGALSTVRLHGPTNFAPTIQHVVSGARQAEKDHIYTILLIITDGEITDMDETIDALVQADDAALSIIIVGVGNDCDFKAMVQLDGDDAPLASRKRTSRRDLVQFVPLRDFDVRGACQSQLAAELLREVPTQIERWAALKGLRKEDFAPSATPVAGC